MTNSNIDSFKLEVRRFDAIDNEIKEINGKMKPFQERLKELKNTRKELENNICSFMETNEIGECKLQEGALLYKNSKNVIPLKKDTIKENIIKFFNDYDPSDFKGLSSEEKAEQLFKFVYENREYKENKQLKRV
jgi:hypothetical protein